MKPVKIITVVLAPISAKAVSEKPVHTPNPHVEPMWPSCIKFYQSQPNDTCQTLADKNGLDLAEFIALNRGVGGLSGCSRGNAIAGYWYCVKPNGWE
ncbi:hypothetical protein CGRA01v4_13581 [Colletotrichum graminicola]|uniref:LysM domain-containing protein n=1 Tax=Colletotrichum graminicola (strain M1.001 / M2 / FGSC 10212) TaxID=645133 RepID=E3QRM9_COLGM|nr:uncharacterized protein GLRG_08796 [Colletotrichum graminicola M1.001]EFQ33517.1 hypothetical protein GLRG_08796 [Colletotrichum graminicola M1.001]WDK22291.1 hypothetical protein CGRA01v4_13581 [Colletotrichum graminicola]